MKKLFFLIFIAMLICNVQTKAAEVRTYIVNQNFDGVTAIPSGWTIAADATNYTLFYGGTYDFTTPVNQLNLKGATLTKAQGTRVSFPSSGEATEVYVEFDWLINAVGVDYRHAFGVVLQSATAAYSTSTFSNSGDIMTLYLTGSDGLVHFQNITNDTIFGYKGTATGKFFRAATDLATCNINNAATATTCTWAEGQTIHVKAILDFVNKKIKYLKLANMTTGETPYEASAGYNFYDINSTSISKIAVCENQSNTVTTGANIPKAFNVSFDNIQTYTAKDAATAAVTINYLDQTGAATGKAARIVPNAEVGATFTVDDLDKITFTQDGYYYSYDATTTTNNGGDNILVDAAGSTINLRFKKTAVTSGTYSWLGNASEFWNDFDDNFSINNSTTSFQNGNSVAFASADAPIKDVIANTTIDLGAGNVTIDAKGYSFSGTGKLTGTGSIYVNASTKLNLKSELTGSLYLNKDTLEIDNVGATSKIVAKDQTVLNVNTTADYSPAITGETNFTIIPKAHYLIGSAIKGVSKLNYVLVDKGKVSTLSGMPKLNCTLDSAALINVSTLRGDTTYFGSTVSYPKNTINLNDSVYMIYMTNPVSAGTTTVTLGALTGTAKSKLIGNNIRKMTYVVGSLNTDATFAGSLAPYTTSAYLDRADFDLTKTGKGVWTLSGNSPDFFGNVKVLNGTLKVDGVLCDGVGQYDYRNAVTVLKQIAEVLVADTATLAGSGFIGSTAVTMNGTLTGNLTFLGSVSLKADLGAGGATTLINVSASGVDKITVKGDLYYGGKLKIKVASLPQVGDYKILDFANYYEVGPNGFDTVELPSANWTFDYKTGILSYKGGDVDPSAVTDIDYSKTIQSLDYFNVQGQRISKYSTGLVILKVQYTDGTSANIKKYIPVTRKL